MKRISFRNGLRKVTNVYLPLAGILLAIWFLYPKIVFYIWNDVHDYVDCKKTLSEIENIFNGTDERRRREYNKKMSKLGIDSLLCGNRHGHCVMADQCGRIAGIDCSVGISDGGGYYFIDIPSKEIIHVYSVAMFPPYPGYKPPAEAPFSWTCTKPKRFREDPRESISDDPAQEIIRRREHETKKPIKNNNLIFNHNFQ